jgi:acyl carrier protein
MTRDESRTIVLEELARLAPESDPGALPETAELREELDLDSMDFLNFVTALNVRTGIAIPESAYAELATIGGAVGYLVRHGVG